MKKKFSIPTYELICKATSGDESAIIEVLKFYNAYISKICLCSLRTGQGKTHMIVDNELKGKIHSEVIKTILKFDFVIR